MTSEFTMKQKLEAIDRELAYRRRVYARRVEQGAMTQKLADRQIAIFEEIKWDYETLAEKERLF
jgi:hypothetical protein